MNQKIIIPRTLAAATALRCPQVAMAKIRFGAVFTASVFGKLDDTFIKGFDGDPNNLVVTQECV